VATPAYVIDTVEGEDGTERPNECLWTPAGKEAENRGFIVHNSMLICGIGTEDEPPSAFVALGHGYTWTAVCEGAAAYMLRVHEWGDLYSYPSYPGDEAPAVAPRMPLPEQLHAVFLLHPHPDRPCGCQWDDQWRIVYVPATEPGAIAVTVLRHPAADPPANPGAAQIPDAASDAATGTTPTV